MWVRTQASGTGLTLVSALAPTLGIELPYWARLVGVLVGFVMLVWPVLTYSWNEFREASLALKIFLVCCTLPTASIWGMSWWIAPIRTVVPIITPSQAPKSIPPVKPPPPPWVTQDEIEQQRKLGRTLLIYSPEELVSMFGLGQELKVYVGKWIKINYRTSTVPVSETIEKKEYYAVRMAVPTSLFSDAKISAYFDPKKWGDQLLNVRMHDNLRAICQFVGIQRTTTKVPYDSYSDNLVGYNCDLLSS